MQTDKTIVYLDDLTTIEHLQPILRDLAQLGACEFWVSSAVNRGDERFTWFAAEAPGSISLVWPWERTLDRFMRRLLKRLFRASPKFRDVSVALVSRVWRRPGDLGKATRYICGWGDSSTFMFYVAHALGVPSVQIPHGYRVFLNHDATDKLADRLIDPDFSDRNLFQKIIVHTPHQASFLAQFGVSPEKFAILGSPRFTPEWCSRLDAEVQRIGRPLPQKIDVLFFLPNWNYRVRWNLLVDSIRVLGQSSWGRVTIGLHPRIPQGSAAQKLNSAVCLAKELGLKTSEEPASRLIPSSTLVLAAGTSVGLHALSTGRKFLNLGFLSANRTIFDSFPTLTVTTLEEMERKLEALSSEMSDGSVRGEAAKALLHLYVDQGNTLGELRNLYMSEINSVCKRNSWST